jgi:hypothetical protein
MMVKLIGVEKRHGGRARIRPRDEAYCLTAAAIMGKLWGARSMSVRIKSQQIHLA